jgi:hypothetical protein
MHAFFSIVPSRTARLAFLVALVAACAISSAAENPRVFVLTDIENEPDDAMSMVRLLVYANHYDVEGLVATTSIHQQGRVAPERVRRIVSAYGKVRDNLEKHEPGFPACELLLSRVSEGLPVYGMQGVGEGKDSPGSELLIRAVDRDDSRPLWVTVWGGPNVLAQALWNVRAARSTEALDRFVAKLRVYTISDQDDSGPWLRKEFPDLFYIASPEDPRQPGWGGRYVRAWERPCSRLDRMPTKEDRMEIFGILELVLPLGNEVPPQPEAVLAVANQKLTGHAPGDGTMRFRFCPKSAGSFGLEIHSNVPALDGKAGGITAYLPPPWIAQRPSTGFSNWWTDDPSPDAAEGPHHGARTVSRWREDFLADFAKRMLRCQAPASARTGR